MNPLFLSENDFSLAVRARRAGVRDECPHWLHLPATKAGGWSMDRPQLQHLHPRLYGRVYLRKLKISVLSSTTSHRGLEGFLVRDELHGGTMSACSSWWAHRRLESPAGWTLPLTINNQFWIKVGENKTVFFKLFCEKCEKRDLFVVILLFPSDWLLGG